MREIKFRAWNKETKKMIDLNKITPLALDIDPSMVGARTGVYVPDDDRLEIEQFTGCFDKNNKEDYHHDICTLKDHTDRYTIEWSDDGYWYFKGVNSETTRPMTTEHENIGNIHENGDLLNEAEQEHTS